MNEEKEFQVVETMNGFAITVKHAYDRQIVDVLIGILDYFDVKHSDIIRRPATGAGVISIHDDSKTKEELEDIINDFA